jgi:hypothetical protein
MKNQGSLYAFDFWVSVRLIEAVEKPGSVGESREEGIPLDIGRRAAGGVATTLEVEVKKTRGHVTVQDFAVVVKRVNSSNIPCQIEMPA